MASSVPATCANCSPRFTPPSGEVRRAVMDAGKARRMRAVPMRPGSAVEEFRRTVVVDGWVGGTPPRLTGATTRSGALASDGILDIEPYCSGRYQETYTTSSRVLVLSRGHFSHTLGHSPARCRSSKFHACMGPRLVNTVDHTKEGTTRPPHNVAGHSGGHIASYHLFAFSFPFLRTPAFRSERSCSRTQSRLLPSRISAELRSVAGNYSGPDSVT